MEKKQTMIITLVLGLLIVISVVQAVQLQGLKTSLQDGSFEGVSVSQPSASGASNEDTDSRSAGALPANIKELPQMVGGC